MTPRRVRALLYGLSPDGSLRRELDPEGWHWTTTHELLALQAELLDAGNRYYVMAHAKPGSAKLKPLVVNRPHRTSPSTPGTTHAELLAQMRARKGTH